MLSEEGEEIIENMGVYFSKSGRTPMKGRVFAYLLLADPPHKDFYDIQEALEASKSSISLALRSLQESNLVEYTTLKGNRRKHFKVNAEGWMRKSKESLLATTAFNKIIEAVRKERDPNSYPEFNQKIDLMMSFHRELEKTITAFIANWEKKYES